MFSKIYKVLGLVAVALTLGGCAATTSVNKQAFKDGKIKTILVLPPVNSTDDPQATNGVFAIATRPLSESGYYVVPVTWAAEVFQQVGPVKPVEIHALPLGLLRELFNADAVLYLDVKTYGNQYKVINSHTVVKAYAKLVDLRSGQELWSGVGAVGSEEEGFSKAFLIPGLVTSLITKALADDAKSLQVAEVLGDRFLTAGQRKNSIMYGPRSPNYGRD